MTGPAFGKPLGRYRECRYCDWRAYDIPLCRDHGNRTGGDEYRLVDGRAEWRQGYTGPVVPAKRKA